MPRRVVKNNNLENNKTFDPSEPSTSSEHQDGQQRRPKIKNMTDEQRREYDRIRKQYQRKQKKNGANSETALTPAENTSTSPDFDSNIPSTSQGNGRVNRNKMSSPDRKKYERERKWNSRNQKKNKEDKLMNSVASVATVDFRVPETPKTRKRGAVSNRSAGKKLCSTDYSIFGDDQVGNLETPPTSEIWKRKTHELPDSSSDGLGTPSSDDKTKRNAYSGLSARKKLRITDDSIFGDDRVGSPDNPPVFASRKRKPHEVPDSSNDDIDMPSSGDISRSSTPVLRRGRSARTLVLDASTPQSFRHPLTPTAPVLRSGRSSKTSVPNTPTSTPSSKPSRSSTPAVRKAKKLLIQDLPERKFDCKVRFAYMSLFELETQSIVIPYFDDKSKIKKRSVHHQFARFANKSFEQIDTNYDQAHKSDEFDPVIMNTDYKVGILVKSPVNETKNGFTVKVEAQLRATYFSILHKCDQMGYLSVGIPLLGSGYGGIATERSLFIGLQSIFHYFSVVESTSLQLVYIAVHKANRYERLGSLMSYYREFDLSHTPAQFWRKGIERYMDQLKEKKSYAQFPGTDALLRCIKTTGNYRDKRECIRINKEMMKKTKINKVIHSNIDKVDDDKTIEAAQFIEKLPPPAPSGDFENDFSKLYFSNTPLSYQCGTYNVLRKLWIISVYAMYYCEPANEMVESFAECREGNRAARKELFIRYYPMHKKVVRAWNHMSTNAPVRCKCSRLNGYHENFYAFGTRLSHADKVFDYWMLKNMHIGIDEERMMKDWKNLNDDLTMVPCAQQTTVAPNDEELNKKIKLGLYEFFSRRHEIIGESSRNLRVLFEKLDIVDKETMDFRTGNEILGEISSDDDRDEFLDDSNNLEMLKDIHEKVEELQYDVIEKYSYWYLRHVKHIEIREKQWRNRLFRKLDLREQNFEQSLQWFKENGEMKTLDEAIRDTDFITYGTSDESDASNIWGRSSSEEQIDDGPEVADKLHNLGPRDDQCNFCGAICFRGEKGMKCCKKGRIWIPPMKKVPECVNKAFDKHKKQILNINTAHSMASIHYDRIPQAAHGVQAVKVRGQVSFMPSALLPRNPSRPQFANLFVLDRSTEDIVEFRMQRMHSANKRLRNLFAELKEYFDNNNMFAAIYKSMGELKEEAEKDGIMEERIRFRIVPTHEFERLDLHVKHHKGVYANPNTMGKNYISIAYACDVNQDALPRGMTVFLKNPRHIAIFPMNVYDEKCDTLCYPLFFPNGETGFGNKKYKRFNDRLNPYTYDERKKIEIEKIEEEGENPEDYFESHKDVPTDNRSTHSGSSSHSDNENDSGDGEKKNKNGSSSEFDDSDLSSTDDEFDIEQILRHDDEERMEEVTREQGTRPRLEVREHRGEVYPVRKGDEVIPLVFNDMGGANDGIGEVEPDDEMEFENDSEPVEEDADGDGDVRRHARRPAPSGTYKSSEDEEDRQSRSHSAQRAPANVRDDGNPMTPPGQIDVRRSPVDGMHLQDDVADSDQTERKTRRVRKRKNTLIDDSSDEEMYRFSPVPLDDYYGDVEDEVMDIEVRGQPAPRDEEQPAQDIPNCDGNDADDENDEDDEMMDDLDNDCVGFGDVDRSEPTVLARSNGGVPDKKNVKNVGKREFVSAAEYYTFQLKSRKEIPARFLEKSGKLGQLYTCTAFSKISEMRMDAVAAHRAEYSSQALNRSALFEHLKDKVAGKLKSELGMLVTMPSKIPGSPKYMRELVMSAVQLSNDLGHPDLFITFTGSPQWEEIKANIPPGCDWADCPDLVVSAFWNKATEFLDDVLGKKKKSSKDGGKMMREPGMFGEVLWYTYSVEFQQRGMPHIHLLVSLKDHIKDAQRIDEIVSAELPPEPNPKDPDFEKKMRYRKLVIATMLHTPCEGDPTAYCNLGKKKKTWKRCTKDFPKKFSDSTIFGDNAYPTYKRTNSTTHTFYRNGKKMVADSSYVVSHNPELLSKYGCHINVEVVSSIKVMKYMFKYVFKGVDRAIVEICERVGFDKDGNPIGGQDNASIVGDLLGTKEMHPGTIEKRRKRVADMMIANGVDPKDDKGKWKVAINECYSYQDYRAVTAIEALWRIQGRPIHGSSHVVHRAFVHQEGEETIIFKRGQPEKAVERISKYGPQSMLTAWFEANKKPQALPDGRTTKDLTYIEMFKFYRYDCVKKAFIFRKKDYSRKILARIQTPQPRFLELTAVRLLALNTRGPTSFEELRTVDGVVYNTCLDAALARKLMNNEMEWMNAMEEVGKYANPRDCRRFYANILIACAPSNAKEIFEAHKDVLVNNNRWTEEQKVAHALRHIRFLLQSHGMDLVDFQIEDLFDPDDLPARIAPEDDDDNPEANLMTQQEHQDQADSMYGKLNADQKKVVDFAIRAVGVRREHRKENVLFINGPGGTGKTFCYTTMYHQMMALGKKVLCVAHTGIAATLLPQGCTTHRMFHIPIELDNQLVCKMDLAGNEANNLRSYDAVIWDEACMSDRRIVDAVNNLFMDLHNSTDLPFGGTVIIMGGDWRQILPIVEGIRDEGVLDYTIKKSSIWPKVREFKLKINQRAAKDPHFSDFILAVGDGSNYVDERRRMVEMPAHMICRADRIELVNFVFDDLNDMDRVKKSAILTLDNKTAIEINNHILDQLPGVAKTYLSTDQPDEENGIMADPQVFANQTPSGMPPHKLNLKVGAQVVLLRNMNVRAGLCNGTRLTIHELGRDLIICVPNTKNEYTPEKVFFHRQWMTQSGKNAQQTGFKRLQFPIRLAYACTINKSQGQTLDRAGVVLHYNCFSHGQLYVALSRVRASDDIKVHHFKRRSSDDYTVGGSMLVRNIVYKDAFK